MPYIQKAEIDLDTQITSASIEHTLHNIRDTGMTRIVFIQKEQGLTEKLIAALETAHALHFRLIGLDGWLEELCQATTVNIRGIPTVLNAAARRVVEMVNFYRFDFYSHEADAHDQLAGRHGNFSKSVFALKTIHDIYKESSRNKFLEARIGICEKNYEQVENIVLFLSRLQADRIILRFKNWRAGFSEVLPFIHRAIQASMMCKVWTLTTGIPLCLMTDYVHHVYEVFSPMGTGDKLKRCHSCCYDETCKGIDPEYLNLHGAEEFVPVSEGSHVAEIQKWQK